MAMPVGLRPRLVMQMLELQIQAASCARARARVRRHVSQQVDTVPLRDARGSTCLCVSVQGSRTGAGLRCND